MLNVEKRFVLDQKVGQAKEVKPLGVDGTVKYKVMNKDKLKQVAKELKGASKKHSGQADKIMSAIKQKHPFYPSDDPIIKRRLKEDEEKYRKENEGIQNFRNVFNDRDWETDAFVL